MNNNEATYVENFSNHASSRQRPTDVVALLEAAAEPLRHLASEEVADKLASIVRRQIHDFITLARHQKDAIRCATKLGQRNPNLLESLKFDHQLLEEEIYEAEDRLQKALEYIYDEE